DNLHVDPAVKAAESGIHILVEKPIAMTLEDADRIIASAARYGVKLMVNFILRFDPRYRFAYERVSSGGIGEVVTMWGRRTTLLETARKYRKFSNLLHDVIIHDIDMFNLMSLSEPSQAYCVKVRKACSGLGVDDAYLGIVRYRNGAAASFETSWVLPTSSPHWLDARLHIVGTGGAIYIDLQSHGLEVVDDVKFSRPDLSNWPVVGGRLVGNLREAVNHFVDCVAGDKMPWPGGVDARKALAVVIALSESAETERPVALG
ncbi:MAG: Gfo/Idh/MocA family oxidoreductase, partial [Nitrososphaerota archaeon]